MPGHFNAAYMLNSPTDFESVDTGRVMRRDEWQSVFRSLQKNVPSESMDPYKQKFSSVFLRPSEGAALEETDELCTRMHFAFSSMDDQVQPEQLNKIQGGGSSGIAYSVYPRTDHFLAKDDTWSRLWQDHYIAELVSFDNNAAAKRLTRAFSHSTQTTSHDMTASQRLRYEMWQSHDAEEVAASLPAFDEVGFRDRIRKARETGTESGLTLWGERMAWRGLMSMTDVKEVLEYQFEKNAARPEGKAAMRFLEAAVELRLLSECAKNEVEAELRS